MLPLLSRGWETKKFPVEVCTEPHQGEKGVFDSKVPYFCVLFNPKWSEQFMVKYLFPYVCKEGKKLFYGWVDSDGNYCDHKEKAIHGDDEKVVAWKKAPKGFVGFEAP